MPSKRRLAPVVGRDGINSGYSREQEISTVELDTTFGRLLGLAEGQKVYNHYPCVIIHVRC
jgi:peroxin-1